MKGFEDGPRMLTPPEVARELRVAYEKVIGWIRSGELPATNVASGTSTLPRYRVDRADLRAFELARSVEPPAKRRRRAAPAPRPGGYMAAVRAKREARTRSATARRRSSETEST